MLTSYHLSQTLQVQSYFKSTPRQRLRVDLLLLFFSERTYESCIL